MVNNHGDRFRPLIAVIPLPNGTTLYLFMAYKFKWGWSILSTYHTWDDPPSKGWYKGSRIQSWESLQAKTSRIPTGIAWSVSGGHSPQTLFFVFFLGGGVGMVEKHTGFLGDFYWQISMVIFFHRIHGIHNIYVYMNGWIFLMGSLIIVGKYIYIHTIVPWESVMGFSWKALIYPP